MMIPLDGLHESHRPTKAHGLASRSLRFPPSFLCHHGNGGTRYRVGRAAKALPFLAAFALVISSTVKGAPVFPSAERIAFFLEGHPYLQPFLIGTGSWVYEIEHP